MPSVAQNSAEAPLVLAIDVGSSSVRVEVYDRRGRDVRGTAAAEECPLDVAADGTATLDPDRLFDITVELIHRAVASVTRAYGERAEIAAVAVATFWHSFLGIDEQHRPTTPLFLWADSRGRDQMPVLRARLNERAVHARTGCLLHWSYWPVKLLWLQQAMPAALARTVRLVSFGEYLQLRLLGRAVCGVSMASGTGIFDQNRQTWDEEVLGAIGLPAERLLPLAGQGEAIVGPRPAYARRWPALKDARWFPAVGDGAVSNVGSGCVTQDRMALMVGTSAALRVAWRGERTEIPWGAWCYRVDEHRFVVGCADSNGGNLFAWLADTLKLPAAATLERELAESPADGHGLTVLPFIAGERGPGYAAHARGAVLGLTAATRPVEIVRASLESVALRFALMYRIVTSVLPEPKQAIATGGALLRSPAWAQIVADAVGRPVVASGEREASSRGAALLALERLGAIENVETMPTALRHVYTPNADAHRRLDAAQTRHRHFYQRLVVEEQPG